jgi:hypothetical protein
MANIITTTTYDGKPEVGKLYWYSLTRTVVKIIAMDKPIIGAPFFSTTVWMLPQTRNGSYPFSLPSKILPFYLENINQEPTSKQL